MDMANIILVASNTKQGGRIGYPGKKLGDLEEVLKNYNIHFFKDELDEPKIPVTLSISNNHLKIYKKALDIKSGDLGKSVKLFGKFYSYPACCIEKYIDDLKEGKYSLLRYWDQILQSGKSHNLFAIYHIPCNPECDESKALDKYYKDKLNEIDEKIVKGYLDGKKSSLTSSLAVHADHYYYEDYQNKIH